MKWNSSPQIIGLVDQYLFLLPKDFDYKFYIEFLYRISPRFTAGWYR
jgi:hypothetical protein